MVPLGKAFDLMQILCLIIVDSLIYCVVYFLYINIILLNMLVNNIEVLG